MRKTLDPADLSISKSIPDENSVKLLIGVLYITVMLIYSGPGGIGNQLHTFKPAFVRDDLISFTNYQFHSCKFHLT